MSRANSLVAPSILLLANLLKRSGNITFSAELGLSAIEWSMIARIGEDGPLTQTELAEMSLFDKGQVSRAATLLADKSLIVRNSRTWRSLELHLTAKGRKVFAAIMKTSRQRHKKLIAGIDAAELRCFVSVMKAIAVNAKTL